SCADDCRVDFDRAGPRVPLQTNPRSQIAHLACRAAGHALCFLLCSGGLMRKSAGLLGTLVVVLISGCGGAQMASTAPAGAHADSSMGPPELINSWDNVITDTPMFQYV